MEIDFSSYQSNLVIQTGGAIKFVVVLDSRALNNFVLQFIHIPSTYTN